LRPRSPIIYGVALLGMVQVVGTLGYTLIEGVSVFDAAELLKPVS
jgi:hypothetical protein